MKNFNRIIVGLAAVCCACTPAVKVSCNIDGAPESTVIVKHLELDGFGAVDTLKTDAAGSVSFKVNVEAGKPEFVYVYYKDTKLASLLLEKGDAKVVVDADTLGNYSVTGSQSSEDLRQVELDFSSFLSRFFSISDRGELVKEYIAYYRGRVKYITEHPFSMTIIPVLYQKVNQSAPIFAQPTDAIIFRSACDSLKQVYPESKYVKALEKETKRRENAMQFEDLIRNAKPSNVPEVNLPDMDGKKVALSSLVDKAVILHFWDSSDPAQKMFNIEVLMPLYNDFKDKGLQIYSVGLDVDKVRWATVVRSQKLPWINVCDGFGALCPAVSSYNLTSLPTSVLLFNGELVNYGVTGAYSLRKELEKLLK